MEVEMGQHHVQSEQREPETYEDTQRHEAEEHEDEEEYDDDQADTDDLLNKAMNAKNEHEESFNKSAHQTPHKEVKKVTEQIANVHISSPPV